METEEIIQNTNLFTFMHIEEDPENQIIVLMERNSF
jgi:hypothetical protein